MKKLITLFSSAFVILALAGTAHAAGTNCQIIYGGGEVCPPASGFNIEKKALQPSALPNTDVTFQITVTNTGSQTIPTLTVTDTLPDFLNFKSGPGSFDASKKTITYTVDNLAPGQSNTQTIVVTTADSKVLPSDKSTVCVPNHVVVVNKSGDTDAASAQVCIEKQVVPPTTKGGLPIMPVPQKQFQAPPTGPEMLALIGLIPAGLGGFMLRRKTNRDFKGGEK